MNMRCHLAKQDTNALGSLSVLALILTSQAAMAGPPFLTDDPVPVEPGHWEINTYSASTFARRVAAGTIPGVDANYGAVENLQLHILVTSAYSAFDTANARFGIGDIELGMKYRFLTPDTGDWWPQVGVYPLLDLPTGDAAANLGTGRTHAFFPIWMQKDFGKWTTYGGGGYWINPGPGNRNFWFTGWVLQYALTDTLALGGEVFHDEVIARYTRHFRLPYRYQGQHRI